MIILKKPNAGTASIAICLLLAISAPSAGAQPAASGDRVAALTASLTAAMTTAENYAAASGFPYHSTLAAVSRSMWQTFYQGDYTVAEEEAAVARAAQAAETPVTKEASLRMTYELKLN